MLILLFIISPLSWFLLYLQALLKILLFYIKLKKKWKLFEDFVLLLLYELKFFNSLFSILAFKRWLISWKVINKSHIHLKRMVMKQILKRLIKKCEETMIKKDIEIWTVALSFHDFISVKVFIIISFFTFIPTFVIFCYLWLFFSLVVYISFILWDFIVCCIF